MQSAQQATARAIAGAHSHREGALLPILHAVQEEFGCIPPQTIPAIADVLNLSRAEVHGVVSFYHDFRDTPAGRHVVKLCRAEACQAMGGAALAEQLLEDLDTGWSGTTADGRLTIEPVYCLGLCACAPAAMIDEKPHGRLDAARLTTLLSELAP
ncbi:formate dehydrogenase subunit gamma [Pseudohoeflea coraliihabitans]|uniref:Formate dehydrogenase subunit gamma n=1 Tax=Pseudohoeflea coraliihabitans TaxID=2860393 RepID=A0ABS6WQX9_9HYPH|nr:formate dehydrogenase subunit gamma [Pseudohoeflea sp. DP4N28-3]